jgi:hypothetical protein
LSAAILKDVLYISAGTNGKKSMNDVWSSKDGISWTKLKDDDDKGFSARTGHVMLSFAGKLWIIGGRSGDKYLPDVWSSADGIDWKIVTINAGFTPRADFAAITYKDRMWVLGGFGPKGTTPPAVPKNAPQSATQTASQSSPQGVSQAVTQNSPQGVSQSVSPGVPQGVTQVSSQSAPQGTTPSAAKVFIPSVPGNEVWWSVNGYYWASTTANAEFGQRSGFTAVEYMDKIYIIGGVSPDNKYKRDLWASQ